MIESYSLEGYKLDENKQPALDEDDAFVQTRTQRLARNQGVKKIPESELPAVKTARQSDVTGTAEAWDRFSSAFPHAEYQVIPTSSANLQCGLYAPIATLTAMGLDIDLPTIDDLRQVVESGAYQEQIRAFIDAAQITDNEGTSAGDQLTNINNLTIDQVACVLQIWGCAVGLQIQVGWVSDNESPTLVPVETPDSDILTVWVYNDNATTWGAAYNHYSGIKTPDDFRRRSKRLADTKSKAVLNRRRRRPSSIDVSEDENEGLFDGAVDDDLDSADEPYEFDKRVTRSGGATTSVNRTRSTKAASPPNDGDPESGAASPETHGHSSEDSFILFAKVLHQQLPSQPDTVSQ